MAWVERDLRSEVLVQGMASVTGGRKEGVNVHKVRVFGVGRVGLGVGSFLLLVSEVVYNVDGMKEKRRTCVWWSKAKERWLSVS